MPLLDTSQHRPPQAHPAVRAEERITKRPEAELHYENVDVRDVLGRHDVLRELGPAERAEAEHAVRVLHGAFLGYEEDADSGVGPARAQALFQRTTTALLRQLRKPPPKKPVLRAVYEQLVQRRQLAPRVPALEQQLVKHSMRSESGVLVVTVLTSPYPAQPGSSRKQAFTCEHDCYYCPNQPGQPRSYLRDEPAVLRANQNGFDPVLQFFDRVGAYAAMGHRLDKIEVLVLGGTWSSYNTSYQESFVRDLFFAANAFDEDFELAARRAEGPRRTLRGEQLENEAARTCRIIGLTIETRPDSINVDELRRLRAYGVTRVQLGVQHVDDEILTLVNRRCSTARTKLAIRDLKDACFKVDVHLMPNLPGATPEKDDAMFETMCTDADLQADQWKIYPCEIVPWTVIAKWFRDGKYTPYPEAELREVVIRAKTRVPPWVRLNRVLRDIPHTYQIGGEENELRTDIRNELQRDMRARGLECKCIRCREIGSRRGFDVAAEARLVVRSFPATQHEGGMEHFVSFECQRAKDGQVALVGFCRVRIPPAGTRRGGATGGDSCPVAFPELHGCALLRELHVYGSLLAVGKYGAGESATGAATVQHLGFGKQLVAEAERLALDAGCPRVAVIAGIGVRDYYRALGFVDAEGDGGFLIKECGSRRGWEWWRQHLRRQWQRRIAAAFRLEAWVFAVLAAALAVAGAVLTINVRSASGEDQMGTGFAEWARWAGPGAWDHTS